MNVSVALYVGGDLVKIVENVILEDVPQVGDVIQISEALGQGTVYARRDEPELSMVHLYVTLGG